MNVLVTLLWGAFGRILGSLLFRALVALGFSAVTYGGLDILQQAFSGYILGQLNATSSFVYGVLDFYGCIAVVKMFLATLAATAAANAAKTAIKLTTSAA